MIFSITYPHFTFALIYNWIIHAVKMTIWEKPIAALNVINRIAEIQNGRLLLDLNSSGLVWTESICVFRNSFRVVYEAGAWNFVSQQTKHPNLNTLNQLHEGSGSWAVGPSVEGKGEAHGGGEWDWLDSRREVQAVKPQTKSTRFGLEWD